MRNLLAAILLACTLTLPARAQSDTGIVKVCVASTVTDRPFRFRVGTDVLRIRPGACTFLERPAGLVRVWPLRSAYRLDSYRMVAGQGDIGARLPVRFRVWVAAGKVAELKVWYR